MDIIQLHNKNATYYNDFTATVYNVCNTKTVYVDLKFHVLITQSSHCGIQISISSILTCNGSCPCVMWCVTYCSILCRSNCSIYRVSQEECARLREGVRYVKVYRYNPKHLCPKLNGYGDNGQRSLKLWQLLHTYRITKYILKLAGICGFCNVNICT